MLIQFQIAYKTHYGQQLMLTGSLPVLGSSQKLNACAMILVDVNNWIWVFELELNSVADFSYRYFVNDNNFNSTIEEWGPDRIFKAENLHSRNWLIDNWRTLSDPDFTLFSSAFVNGILKQEKLFEAPTAKVVKAKNTILIKFKPSVARIKPGHRVAVSGSAKNLGYWDETKSLPLGNPSHPQWIGEITATISEFPIKYKYLIQNKKGAIEFWEKSPDRIIYLPEGDLPDVIEIGNEKFDFPCLPWKGTGVAVPVFSLRRENGFGVGEFSDLKLMVDWAGEVGMKLIQILPVNDTVARHTWQDSYPYAAISVFALHPLYINILEIGRLDSSITQQIIESQGQYLNKLSKIDYEAVMALKSRFFKLIYDQKKAELHKNTDFRSFMKANGHWLRPYAAFSFLRDLFNTPDFNRWGEYSKPTAILLAQLTDENSPHYHDIGIHYFIQYHAHLQLLDAAEYARSKGVVLKGDIPIGIFRNSVDAWLNPHLYHMDCQAGAPPDDFSAIGQNWRFPTYNWEEMAKNNYGWWQERLQQMSTYFDAFRIDHILGFFRIWEIPASQVEGLMGYFNPSLHYFRDEIYNSGIRFDEKRMCQPYIREHFLAERFGDLTNFVKSNYLTEYAPGCYNLKNEFDTQQKIEERLISEPDASAEERNRFGRIINGLNSLVAEVIFLVAPGTNQQAFFPRNALHFTRSYIELDNETKQAVNELYIDYFYRRNEDFWRGKAMTKLPVIKNATNMLLCGEDLGMVPACVPTVMNYLGILSLEVQRMPKDPKIKFGIPGQYPYLSVATPSSHDTSTIRGWWEEDAAQSQKFYNEMLGNHGPAPAKCETSIVRQVVIQHLYSPSMWAIFPIQDLLGMDENLRLPSASAERINQPGNPNHYWRFRLHLKLEELIKHSEFNEMVRYYIENSGRSEIY